MSRIDLAAPGGCASIEWHASAVHRQNVISPRIEMKLTLCAFVLCLAGCVTKPREGIYRPGETEDQRIHREVFYSDWLRPSVSQEDREFFYEPFWKSR